ncbi:tripartite tricarboxylate transporter substrate binding protein [Bordetella sp. BOR01]|uniref:Bug family tripartite tricarboxylate transporter substrate binding protein n=1 Tax=Bordetella sp. BOR01 TaxID=2854779 RepID=UPI001C48ABC8|nr:tripartite tricarboxylate transporter substrate-binding protein [Bordetella sp. BOR01]MBV7482977.1 tripartite tricarboxylate transporter substrate binding protein [Bordetella sp. BOR01]
MQFQFRARLACLSLLAVFHLSPVYAQEQAYPSRPVRLIVPFPPGGAVDAGARLLANKLAERWSQPVVVENKPGGNTIIGAQSVLAAPHDGYTLFYASSSFTTLPSLNKSVPFSIERDFVPVATFNSGGWAVMASLASGANSIKEIVAYAKANPQKLAYASSGGSVQLLTEAFLRSAQINALHVPYKGAAGAMTALITNDAQLYFGNPLDALASAEGKRVKIIAVTSKARIPIMSTIPTVGESGLPGFTSEWWGGLMAPAGTPKPVLDQLFIDVSAVLQQPDVQTKIRQMSGEPGTDKPGDLGKRIAAELQLWSETAKASGIEPG